jgi:hypothetical protein
MKKKQEQIQKTTGMKFIFKKLLKKIINMFIIFLTPFNLLNNNDLLFE